MAQLTLKQIFLLSLALVVTVAAGPSPVAASHSHGIDLFEPTGEDDRSFFEKRSDVIDGTIDRIKYDVTNSFVGQYVGTADTTGVEGHADNLQTSFNAANDTLVEYTNEYCTACADEVGTQSAYAIELETGDETTTRYVVVTASNDSITSAEMVSETNATVENADDPLVLRDYAATRADDELESFVEQYAEPKEAVDYGILSRMANQYAGDIELPDSLDLGL